MLRCPQVKYQYVRQTRVPKTLPQVLAVNCGLQARQRHRGDLGGCTGARQREGAGGMCEPPRPATNPKHECLACLTLVPNVPPPQDKEDLCWWQPVPYAAVDLEGQPVTRQRAWLPPAVAVTADPEGWTVAVQVR